MTICPGMVGLILTPTPQQALHIIIGHAKNESEETTIPLFCH